MARKVLEVSIFWAGELLTVKQLPRDTKVDELNLPETGDVVVRTEVCEVTPRKRSPIDLPLGALGVVALLLHAATFASFTSLPEPSVVTSEARAASSYAVAAEPDAVLDSIGLPSPESLAQIEASRRCMGHGDSVRLNRLWGH